MSLIWKIVISRWILDVSLCRICIHRLTHTPMCASRGRPLCIDAGTMQSPMQFRAIQVRLALRASDTVTVYPSPTHTHDENTIVESRTNASNGGVVGGGTVQLDAALVYVLFLREVGHARPQRRPSPSTSSTTLLRVTHGENYVADDPSARAPSEDQECASHVRQVIKRSTMVHLKTGY